MNQKELFWISVTVFLTMIAWMILDIYKAKSGVLIDPGLKKVQAVDFTLKTDILNILKEKSP